MTDLRLDDSLVVTLELSSGLLWAAMMDLQQEAEMTVDLTEN
jgi:hypothetical protein